MNVRLHQAAERSIYHPVALQSLGASEAGRDYSHSKVPASVLGTGVSGMSMTVVDDFELVWRECLL
jgi:hypothetical protein